MDILKRSLAPITDGAWSEIDNQAKDILISNLTARKLIDVSKPQGFGFSAVSFGRLHIPANQKSNGVSYGIHKVQPLIETRIAFELEIWELDNYVRGAKDIELDAVVKASKKLAEFEETAIYHGFKDAKIDGLIHSAGYDDVTFKISQANFIAAVANVVNNMIQNGINGPYKLAINPELWANLESGSTGYPLHRRLNEYVDDTIVFVPAIKDALIMSTRGGDAELTLGQDISIGYMSHTSEKVKLFLTESFTFNVLEPLAVAPLKSKK